LKEGADCVSGELCAMEGCRRKSAERLGKKIGGDRAGLGGRAAAEFFGEEGGAGNGGGAATAEEAGFGDVTIHDACGQLEDIAANGVADFYYCGRAGKFPGVARVAEVIENGLAEHS